MVLDGGSVQQVESVASGDVASLADRASAAMNHYLETNHLIHHVQDATYFEAPKFLTPGGTGHFDIPQIVGKESHLLSWGDQVLLTGRITKFMILELVAALLVIGAFVWLAKRIRSGQKPRGRTWNLLEALVVFVRDNIARPSIGEHDAHRFLPFLLTLFFFILVLNLLGMIPFLGSATGAIAVTAIFAISTFLVVIGSGMKRLGVVGFAKAQVPHMELHPAMAIALVPGLWCLEVFGLLVKHFVLSIRLFANMFAGHLVLGVFIGLIGVAAASTWLFITATPLIVLAAIALSMLELFVAFLQAYVFTCLAALFIGAAIHPH
ncbi:MAG TPA: F0F1 ATP synthase subunit A [Pirellulaceae bacterium]|nr:F0F1 ATP synthase subunit A [Pirellulaceae bacterium]